MMTRHRSDRGSVSLFVVIMVPALIAAAGLVLDGGRQLEARRAAHGAAEAAARAAVQLTDDELLAGELDVDAAISRAEAELAAQGASGSVAAVGGSIVVTVQQAVDYAILPGGSTISESATATPRTGVGEGSS
jgi:Flp pilus assembly protein TadG